MLKQRPLTTILFLAYLLCWTKMTGNLWLQNWMEIHWSLATKNCKISLRNRRSHSENRGMEEVVKLRSFFRLSLTRQMGQTIIDGIKSFEVANLYYYFDPRSYFDRAEIQQLKSRTNGHPFMYAVRTSGEKFISSLHCVAKKNEK